MGLQGKVKGAILAALLAAILAVGCGGSSGASDPAGDGTSDSAADKADEVELASADEGEPSRTFLKKKGKNKIATFGAEASAKERAAASAVLEENLQAREAGDWSAQCATLSVAAKKDNKEIAEIQGVAGGGCAKELQERAQPLQISKQSRVNTLTGHIDALRAKGDRGWALYHGTGGTDFAMSMEKEGGEWKVGDVLETSLGG